MLKIDLLPKTFRTAAINKLMIVGTIVVLVLVAAFWLSKGTAIQTQMTKVDKQIQGVQADAQEYDKVTSELNQKKGDLQPIAQKVDFVNEADKSGYIYWDEYEKIKPYIYDKAVMSDFSIRPPNSCQFTVQVVGTSQYARFLLDLLRCPELTITGFTVLSAGRGVPSAGEPEPGEWPTARGEIMTAATETAPARTGGVPGMGRVGAMRPGGGPGMMGPGPRPGMMGGMSGGSSGMMGPRPGMMMGGGPGMMPGMGGRPGGGGRGGTTTDPAHQPITIQVSGTLSTTITTPSPASSGATGAGRGGTGMGMGMGGAPGMMGGMSGRPGMMGPGGPGMMGPGGPGMGGGSGAARGAGSGPATSSRGAGPGSATTSAGAAKEG